MRAEASKYHAYARECLELAEACEKPDQQQKLLELSRIWMEAALLEDRCGAENSSSSRAG